MKMFTLGQTQPLLIFPRFSERPDLCVVSILDHYLLRLCVSLQFLAHFMRKISQSDWSPIDEPMDPQKPGRMQSARGFLFGP